MDIGRQEFSPDSTELNGEQLEFELNFSCEVCGVLALVTDNSHHLCGKHVGYTFPKNISKAGSGSAIPEMRILDHNEAHE